MDSKTNLRESYQFYKKNCTDFKPVKKEVYLRIIGGMFKFLFTLVIAGHDVRLGSRLGNLGIRGRKIIPKLDEEGNIKGLAPNWRKTKENWMKVASEKGMTYEQYIKEVPRQSRPDIVYSFNEHSNGMRYKLYWYKKKAIITHISYYSLVLSRANKRAISNAVKAGRDYLSIIEKEPV